MAYIALYRKYRPNNFDDIVGQKSTVEIIKNSIINNKIGHAYLFFGPRGTGKTTIAKIFSKMVNCDHLENGKPCEKCNSCLNFSNSNDIVEIDAASNNGVDEIRELKNKINLVPSFCKYKIYIIDEVHMLTIQAFNALLKTLEEPPKHAIFILATTEPHKIPLTVASRCQKFHFSKISDEEIVNKLKQICKEEKVSVDDKVLTEIARLSDGGLRDAINTLDQLLSYKMNGWIIKDVYDINGTVSYDEINELLLCMLNRENKEIINFVEKINNQGKNITKFIEELIMFLKDILIFNNTNKKNDNVEKQNIIERLSLSYDDEKIYELIFTFNNTISIIETSNYPSILLTISLLKLSKNKVFDKINEIPENIKSKKFSEEKVSIDQTQEEVNNAEKKDIENSNVGKEKTSTEKINSELDNNIINIRINNALATASKENLNMLKKDWSRKDEYLLDKKFGVVAGLLDDVDIVVAGANYLILMSKLESIASRLNSLINDVEKLVKNLYDKNYKVVVLSEKEWLKEKEKYINNIKNQMQYNFIEEPKFEKKKSDKETPVDKLLDLFGEELIEYK